MEWPLFSVLLSKVLNKLLKFLLDVPMFIFKIKFLFSFLFLLFFFISLFVVVGSLLIVSCRFWMVELCDIYFVFVLFLTTFFLLKYGETALHRAAGGGFEQIVKILIEHGSNVHLQTSVLIFFSWFWFYFFVFSHFFICCCGFIIGCFVLIVNGCVVWYLILFCSFFNNFLFVKGWMDRSSLSCW